MTADVAAIVLAAGKGTRFRSATAKVLHRAAGRSLLAHVLEAVRPLGLGQVLVVVGHQAEEVAGEVAACGLDNSSTVLQAEQRGTGHAVQQAMPALDPGIRRVLVLPGDTPLLTAERLERLLAAGQRGGALLSARMEDPTGYGRVVRTDDGSVARIVEHRDADAEELAIDEINAGMYLLDRTRLEEALAQLGDDNAQGELYLTDVVELLAAGPTPVAPLLTAADEVAGVNDRSQLAAAAAMLRRAHLERLMCEVGVSITDPATTYVDVDVEVGPDAVLLPGTILESGTAVGARSVIGPHTHLSNCVVGADAVVHSTRGSDAVVGDGASVGPFTHLRPGTQLGRATKVGAFAETKNAVIGSDSKVPHLAYVGDATVGERVNIACGVITVNYDGRTKSHTTIEDGAFVGCDTMLVAPVTIGPGAYTAAGSTITDDVPPGALAIARSRQSTKEGWAERRRS
ncbi:MAG: bifunctional UDP-N-acetylglucosamine diphosphorylase/glucosamine-1-phosphate N-acetyltransferase GlmU [Nitriliruptoraceae bacterium]